MPHETPSTTARPSTARPEFSALLDQLRSGTRPRAITVPTTLEPPARDDVERVVEHVVERVAEQVVDVNALTGGGSTYAAAPEPSFPAPAPTRRRGCPPRTPPSPATAPTPS